jgi:hypothetical protein
MYASPEDLARYVRSEDPRGVLHHAEDWIRERVVLNGVVPAAVTEATALLAAVYEVNPVAYVNEAEVPNMVRLMILPWST